jgi:hypothetical protein
MKTTLWLFSLISEKVFSINQSLISHFTFRHWQGGGERAPHPLHPGAGRQVARLH